MWLVAAADDMPPVTVLLPVFNGGAHLPAAVRSILGQEYKRFELLVIDDGSTDGTHDYLTTLKDARVRVIRQRNQGLVPTLNHGLAAARHGLIARMDADDLSEPSRLAVQVAFLMDNPGVAAVGSCFVTIDEGGVRTDDVHVAANPPYLRRSIYLRNVFAHGSMTLHRDRALEVGGYRDVGPCEDYDLWLRLLDRYDLANVPEILYRYRVSASQISSASRGQQEACFAALRQELHAAEALPKVSATTVFREGLQHVTSYPQCRRTAQTYAYDHFGLARMVLTMGRVGQATQLLLGLALFTLRKPSALIGLPPFQSLAELRHRIRLRRSRPRRARN